MFSVVGKSCFGTCFGIIFLVAAFKCSTSAAANPENTFTQDILALCSNVTCHPGRECRVLSSGIPECVCRSHCPSRKHPICGSDGLAYENHCDLHRQACIKGIQIRPRFNDHSCLDDPLAKLKREIELAMEEIKQREREHIKVPRACHQNDRDRMREYLISWMTLKAQNYAWHKQGMTFENMLSHYFVEMDSDSNGFVDSSEWLHHLKAKSANSHRDKASRKLRKLCIEALVEEADRNADWRLTSEEFFRLMDKNYQPSNKYCVRDRKHYEDGTRTKVDCNGCTCACGKWICTSHPCSVTPATPIPFTSTEEYNNYEDMDNQVD